MRNRRILASVLALFLMLVATVSRAGQPADEAPSEDDPVRQLVLKAQRAREAGDYDEAIRQLKAALRIRAEPVLHYNLARTYEDAGRLALARTHYELTLELQPNEELRGRTLKYLEALQKQSETGGPEAPTEPTGEKPPTEEPAERLLSERLFHLIFHLSEGVLVDGPTRRNVGLELGAGFRWNWFQVDVLLGVLVEDPQAFLALPGLRFHVEPVYFRVAAQLLASEPLVTGGLLAGLGAQVPFGAGWYLLFGADASVWPTALSLFGVEFRAGVGYGF